MDIVVKNIKSIENSVSKYIFNKYIYHISSNDDINEKDDINKAYKHFQNRIFYRGCKFARLDQNNELLNDLKNMNIADEAYKKLNYNRKLFKIKDYNILPDILRCSYIRKHHHKLHRCCNIIMNDDSDVCAVHEFSENIYFDKYNDLIENLKLNNDDNYEEVIDSEIVNDEDDNDDNDDNDEEVIDSEIVNEL